MPKYVFLKETQTPYFGIVTIGEVKTLAKVTGDQLVAAGFVKLATAADEKKAADLAAGKPAGKSRK